MTDLSTTEIVLIGVLFIVVVLFGAGLAYLVRVVAEQGRQMRDLMPQWAVEMIASAGLSGLAELQEYVESTPNTVDDALLERIETKFDELIVLLRGTEPPARG